MNSEYINITNELFYLIESSDTFDIVLFNKEGGPVLVRKNNIYYNEKGNAVLFQCEFHLL